MEKVKMDKSIENIVFVTEGGIGKVIASTAVVKRLKEEYPEKKIIVVAGAPEIFKYNPNVEESFKFDNPLNFYDRFIKTKNSYIFKVEPYTNTDYVLGKKHLLDVWCSSCGVEWKEVLPEIFFLKNELSIGQSLLSDIKKKNKKLILLQWIGGLIPQDQREISQIDARLKMHRRALPKVVAQQIVNRLISKGYGVGLVQHENFSTLDGAERVFYNLRAVLSLLKHCDGFIGVDSFLHHAAAGMNKKGVVIWGGTDPKKLGYKCQRNLAKVVCDTPFCHRPDTYMFDGDPNVGLWNCPYDDKCLDWTSKVIFDAFEEEMNNDNENKAGRIS